MARNHFLQLTNTSVTPIFSSTRMQTGAMSTAENLRLSKKWMNIFASVGLSQNIRSLTNLVCGTGQLRFLE